MSAADAGAFALKPKHPTSGTNTCQALANRPSIKRGGNVCIRATLDDPLLRIKRRRMSFRGRCPNPRLAAIPTAGATARLVGGYSSVLRRPRPARRSRPSEPGRLRPIRSSSRRGPARRSAYFLYAQAHPAGEVHFASGSRGADALKKRCPFSARAASQPPLVQTIDTA